MEGKGGERYHIYGCLSGSICVYKQINFVLSNRTFMQTFLVTNYKSMNPINTV